MSGIITNNSTQPLTRKQKRVLRKQKRIEERIENRERFERKLKKYEKYFNDDADIHRWCMNDLADEACRSPQTMYIPEHPTSEMVDYLLGIVLNEDSLRPQQIRLVSESLMRIDEESRGWIMAEAIAISRDKRMMRSLLDASGRGDEDEKVVISALMADDHRAFDQEFNGCAMYPW